MSTEQIAAWWWKPSKRGTNFGDELGPEILRRWGANLRHVPLEEAELAIGGSVLQIIHAPRQKVRDGLRVWGCGVIQDQGLSPNPTVEHVAVRGRLSGKVLGSNDDDQLYGDPGILTPRAFPARNRDHLGVGFVRHYVDKRVPAWADRIIDATEPVEEVVAQILRCSTIVSSSLHGLIVAQSYGIPAMRWGHDKVVGGEFKWLDYISAGHDAGTGSDLLFSLRL